MAKVWIVYRPILNYEESIENYLAFAAEADANAAAKRINDFQVAVRARVARLPDISEDGISDDEFVKRMGRRDKAIKNAKWPFGFSFEYDLDHIGNVVEVMELRLVGAKNA